VARRPDGSATEAIGLDLDLADEEAAALAAGYGVLAAALARFPEAELKDVEPPLLAVPAPPAAAG